MFAFLYDVWYKDSCPGVGLGVKILHCLSFASFIYFGIICIYSRFTLPVTLDFKVLIHSSCNTDINVMPHKMAEVFFCMQEIKCKSICTAVTDDS